MKVLDQHLVALEQAGLRVGSQTRDFLGDEEAAMLEDIYGSHPSHSQPAH